MKKIVKYEEPEEGRILSEMEIKKSNIKHVMGEYYIIEGLDGMTQKYYCKTCKEWHQRHIDSNFFWSSFNKSYKKRR